MPSVPFWKLLLSFLFFLFSLCFSLYAFWELARPVPPPLPSLTAEPPTIDFGIVAPEPVRGSARLTNNSKTPLRILHVLVSCNCGEVQLRQGELLPKQSVGLSVTLDLHGRRGTTGTSIEVVYVTDDGIQRKLPIILRAEIKKSGVQDQEIQ